MIRNVCRATAVSTIVVVGVSCALVNTTTYPSRSGAFFGTATSDATHEEPTQPSEAGATGAGADLDAQEPLPVQGAAPAATVPENPEPPEEPSPVSGPITLDGVAELVPGEDIPIVWTISPNRRYVFLSATRTLEGLYDVVRQHEMDEPIHIMMIDDARGRFVALLLVIPPSEDVTGLVRIARRTGYRSAREVVSLEEVITATRSLEQLNTIRE